MEIECLQPADWQRLKRLRLAALQDTPDAFGSSLESASALGDADWARNLSELITFVAVTEQADVGIVRCAPDNDHAASAFLVSMWVAPEARRDGVAIALVRKATQWAGANGYTRLLLDVANGNAPAIGLYDKLNFKPTGETGALPHPRDHILEHRRALVL